MNRLALLVLCLLGTTGLVSCAAKREPGFKITEQSWTGLSEDQKQIALDRLSANCGLPAGTLRSLGDNRVTLQPEPTSSYKSVDCLLMRLRPLGSLLRLGFVGNEAYAKDQ